MPPPEPPSNKTDVIGGSPARPVELKLVVASGPDRGRELLLGTGTYQVGKADSCDLALTDTSVSRVHLVVSLVPGAVKVVDNQSTNGSFVQGARVQTVELPPGGTVRIGKTDLRVMPAALGAGRKIPELSDASRFESLIGQSRPMRELFAVLERLAKSSSDVLISGETGTGKELCAESLHKRSARADGPFAVCDLAAVTPTLFESELFGHVRGAFTGANTERPGAFERAHGGTLFLDEVGELPLEIQPRLLRALERREVKRVGGNAYKKVDVRVVSATHRDLLAMAKAGTFREDLYHRLAVTTVRLPALRERPDDIPVLVDELLRVLGKEPGELTDDTRALLRAYDWPGNVRELRNVVERVVSLGPSALPDVEIAPDAARSPRAEGEALPFKEAKEALVSSFERDYLEGLLRRCEGNIRRASREADIDRVYLKKLLKKHGLRGKDTDEP